MRLYLSRATELYHSHKTCVAVCEGGKVGGPEGCGVEGSMCGVTHDAQCVSVFEPNAVGISRWLYKCIGERYRSILAKTNSLWDSFFFKAITILNETCTN